VWLIHGRSFLACCVLLRGRYSHVGDDGLGKATFDDYENENEAYLGQNTQVVVQLSTQLKRHFEPLQKGCPHQLD
jgi:hypothetical protein